MAFVFAVTEGGVGRKRFKFTLVTHKDAAVGLNPDHKPHIRASAQNIAAIRARCDGYIRPIAREIRPLGNVINHWKSIIAIRRAYKGKP